jgi:hypothetical protein
MAANSGRFTPDNSGFRSPVSCQLSLLFSGNDHVTLQILWDEYIERHPEG